MIEPIKNIGIAVLAIVIAGMFIAVGLVVMGGFNSTDCTGTYDNGDCRSCPTAAGVCIGGCSYNASGDVCYNASGGTTTYTAITTSQGNASRYVIGGVNQIAAQMGTIGIIVAMSIILLLIGGVAAYFGLR